jgi:phenylacetate-CoA ligase
MKKENPVSTRKSFARASPEERQKYLDGRLKELVKYAYEKAPAIKKRFDEAGISPSKVSTIKDLEGLRPLRKDKLAELDKANPPFGGLVTVPPEELSRIYVSPGPIYDPHHKSKSFWRRQVQVLRALGIRKGDIVINSWAYHLMPAGLMVFDEPLIRAGATVIPTGVGNTELQVQIMHDLKVTSFFGTPTFFVNIIRKAEEMGYDVRKDFHLRLAVIGAEMGGGPIRDMVEQKYGIIARDFYATADVGSLAYECSKKSGMHLADEIIVEIADPETGKELAPGEVGELVLTPIDETYPLIRFGTGDLAALTYEPCPCGRTSPRLSRILGRIGDAVRTRGAFIHPRELQPALDKFSELASYQAVVTRPAYRDEFVLRAELKTEEGINKEKLTEQLKKAVSDAVRIRLDRVQFVAKGVIPKEHKIIVDERVY